MPDLHQLAAEESCVRDLIAAHDRYRQALERILNHGETHDEPCWALHQGDCAEVMQEIARVALGSSENTGEGWPDG